MAALFVWQDARKTIGTHHSAFATLDPENLPSTLIEPQTGRLPDDMLGRAPVVIFNKADLTVKQSYRTQ